MKPSPLVSICMPAYNAEQYIAEALDSILAQTYPNIEVIVVNDGSTDSTAKVLEAYGAKGVKVIHQENKGQCAAANRAFRESEGDLIKFFDADDLLNPENIALQVEKLAGSDGYIASSEWARFYTDPAEADFKPEKVWQDMKPMDWLVKSLWDGPNMMQCAIWLIPRKVLDKSGLWDERLSLINDFDFMIRVLLASEGVKFTKGAKLYYRSAIAQGSLSGQKSRKAMESAWLSTDLGCGHMLNFEDSERTRKVCADSYQLWAYNFYPEYPELTAKAEQKVKELGGSDYKLPSGKKLAMLRKLFGWKSAKQIHQKISEFK